MPSSPRIRSFSLLRLYFLNNYLMLHYQFCIRDINITLTFRLETETKMLNWFDSFLCAQVESTTVLLRRSKLLRSASTGQEIDTPNGMTVTNPNTSQSSVLLAKHWGPERAVHVLREPNCSLGISIVGGKVRASGYCYSGTRTRVY